MKTKNVEKKLVLNKKTLSNLNSTQMNGVQGGLLKYDSEVCPTFHMCPTDQTCLSICPTCHMCPTDGGPTCGDTCENNCTVICKDPGPGYTTTY